MKHDYYYFSFFVIPNSINRIYIIWKQKPTREELKVNSVHRPKQRTHVNSPILSLTTQTDIGVLDPPLNLMFGHTVKVKYKIYVFG